MSRFAIVLCSERGGALSVGLLKMACFSHLSLSLYFGSFRFGFLLSTHTNKLSFYRQTPEKVARVAREQ